MRVKDFFDPTQYYSNMSDSENHEPERPELVLSAGAQAATRDVDWSRIQPEGDFKAVLITKSDLERHYGGALPDPSVLDLHNHIAQPKLKAALSSMAQSMSNDPATVQALSDPDLLVYLLSDAAGALKPSADSKVCAVVMREEPSTLGNDFNRAAHLAQGVSPELGALGPRRDPGVILSHELGHCDQDHMHEAPMSIKATAVLKNEYGADLAARTAFPEESRLQDDSRSIGAVHLGLTQYSNQHATTLYEAMGGELNYHQINAAYKEIGLEIGKKRIPGALAELPGTLRPALASALEFGVMNTEGDWRDRDVAAGSDAARYRDIHQAIMDGRVSGHEAMAALPAPLRKDVEERFALAVSAATPTDPNLITPILRDVQADWKASGKHDPDNPRDPVSVGAKLYIEASERYFPNLAEAPTAQAAARTSISLSLPSLNDDSPAAPSAEMALRRRSSLSAPGQ